jgi:predicted amino acid racemase
VSGPRLEVDLEAVEHNAAHLVGLLAPRGIRVIGVTKAVLGWSPLAEALLRAGVAGLGDSRVENLAALRLGGTEAPLTLIRAPMLSQVDRVVRTADISLNTEPIVLRSLSEASGRLDVGHGVVLMVELGDLREGLPVDDVVDAARTVDGLPGITLAGLGTNLACQSGVAPDQTNMDQLSALVDEVEAVTGRTLATVSGGNSASLGWAMSTIDVGRVDELRLGEAILLGVDPLDRQPIDGLRTDAFRLVAEVIEVKTKPSSPWGSLAQTAFGDRPPTRPGSSTARRAILALGRQDVDPDGLLPPAGITVCGASSDHLVVEVGDIDVQVGDELAFRPDYSALLRAATSPFVTTIAAPTEGRGGSSSRSGPSRSPSTNTPDI